MIEGWGLALPLPQTRTLTVVMKGVHLDFRSHQAARQASTLAALQFFKLPPQDLDLLVGLGDLLLLLGGPGMSNAGLLFAQLEQVFCVLDGSLILGLSKDQRGRAELGKDPEFAPFATRGRGLQRRGSSGWWSGRADISSSARSNRKGSCAGTSEGIERRSGRANLVPIEPAADLHARRRESGP